MITRVLASAGAACAIFLPTAAMAYIGPGAGASLAGSLFGVLAAIFVAIGVVLFWPLRLVYKKLKGAKRNPETASADETMEKTPGSVAE